MAIKYKLTISKDVSNLIKFLAAILIVLHHYSQYAISELGSTNPIIFLLSTQAGYFGVAVFFFLSGYGLMESELKNHLNIRAFFRRRFLKVYLPVLAVTALWLPWYYYINDKYSEILTNGGGNLLVLRDLTIGFGDEVLWFVRVLFWLYGLFWVFAFIRSKNTAWGYVALAVLSIAVYIINDYSISAPLFTIGILASLWKEKTVNIFCLCLIPLLVCMLIVGIQSYYTGGPALLTHSAFNYIAIGIMILIFTRFPINIQVPAILGIISFDIYLVHNKVLQLLRHHYDSVSIWLFVAFAFLVAIAFFLFRTKVLRIK